MTIYYLSHYLQLAYMYSQSREHALEPATESQKRAVELFEKTVLGEIGLSAVQGPPGTGKTSVFDIGVNRVWKKIVDDPERVIVVYVAPTNHLVVEAFTRFSTTLLRNGFSSRSIISLARVYGSRIAPCKDSDVLKLDVELSCSDLRSLMGDLDPENVRFIFTTEYQRISRKLVKHPGRVHFVVDEASKTPFYRVFLPLAKSILSNPEIYYPRSMIVLGDPRQAITVDESLRIYHIDLLMEYVEKMLKEYKLYDDYFVFLDTTFRLPGPTEQPVSWGFYDGKLKAYENFGIRYGKFKDLFKAVLGIARNELSKVIDTSKSLVKTILDKLDEALTNGIPIVVFETRTFPKGDTFHAERVKVAYIAGLYLSIIASKLAELAEQKLSVGITAPYSDLVQSAGFYVRKRIRELGRSYALIKATTVQSVVGGEFDIVVTMLGKEWSIAELEGEERQDVARILETMYFLEPEVLNVQLSRHKLFLVIIGNLERMRQSAKTAPGKNPRLKLAKKWIKQTVEVLKNLAGENRALNVPLKTHH